MLLARVATRMSASFNPILSVSNTDISTAAIGLGRGSDTRQMLPGKMVISSTNGILENNDWP
jgi:hypothetical protein